MAYDSAYVMAYLEVTLVEKPDWFNFEIIDNFEIIYKVFDEVRLFVDDFRTGNDGKKDSGNSAKSKSKEVVEGE